jgi:hypothetical protein
MGTPLKLRTHPPARHLPGPVVSAATVLFLCLAAPIAVGAGRAGEQAPDFPPGEFTDGGRYSLEDLRGKAVVLHLYEKL